MAGANVLIVLADGFEEIEAIAPLDILRRSGINVKLAGLSSREITSARGIKISADVALDELGEEFDAVIFPGGALGAENLSKSEKVRAIIKDTHKKGKIVAAICASPALVLAPSGILDGRRATCYPGMEREFPGSVRFSRDGVVVDGNIVTSKGPATALEFGLKLAELLAGKDIASDVRNKMLL